MRQGYKNRDMETNMLNQNHKFITDRFDDGNMVGIYANGLAPMVKVFDSTKERPIEEMEIECLERHNEAKLKGII